MAAAKRTRSRVCGSRLSCFAMPRYLDRKPVPHLLRPRGDKIIGPAFDTHAATLFLSPPMPRHHHAWLAAVLLGALAPARGAAQSSPYLPLDDPRLPLLEHLIARGDIADPSPMVRPFTRVDALRVLTGADTAGQASAALIRRLRAELDEPADSSRWLLAARAGGQAYTEIRRDVYHPLGDGGVRPYAEFTGEASMGVFTMVGRLAAEPRITDDPEWPGRHDLHLAWRMPDAYLSAQFKYGQCVLRADGPELGAGRHRGHRAQRLRLQRDRARARYRRGRGAAFRSPPVPWRMPTARARGCTATFSPTGWASASRTGCVWESGRRRCWRVWTASSTVATGTRSASSSSPTSTASAPTATCCSASTGGTASARGRHSRRRWAWTISSTRTRSGEDRYPNRWAFTFAAFGPMGSGLSWRAFYTQASSLAFRTLNPYENLTDGGVGLGRNFADMDRVTVTVSVPVAQRWLFMPELTLQRQGEGQINDPFPATPEEAGQLPQLFIGTVGAHLAGGAGGERTPGAARPPRLCWSASRGERRECVRGDRQPFRGATAGDAGPEPPGSDQMTHPPPLSRDRLLHLIQRMRAARVVVVGDIMIDRYRLETPSDSRPRRRCRWSPSAIAPRSSAARPMWRPTSPRWARAVSWSASWATTRTGRRSGRSWSSPGWMDGMW